MQLKFGMLVCGLAAGAYAYAQAGTNGWFFECIDPENTQPYSADYNIVGVANTLMRVSGGVSGTVTLGGESGPCFSPARTLDAAGRLAFQVGSLGSVQSDFDDNLALTYGAPFDPVGDFCYARILKNGETPADSVLFGDGGLNTAYVGASQRYFILGWSDNDVDVELQARNLGDAVRLRWRMLNLQTESQSLGLLFAAYVGQKTGNPSQTDPETGANTALTGRGGATSNVKQTADNYIGHVQLPGQRPLRIYKRFAQGSIRFPESSRFLFGQTANYGLRLDNVVPTETPDATATNLQLFGQYTYNIFDNNINLNVFGDPQNNPNPAEEADVFVSEWATVQRFPTAAVAPGGTRNVIQYIRQNWSVGDYKDPYTAVVDAPKLISTDPQDSTSFTPNPFTVRCYVDNQYANIDKEVPLNNVQFRIFLPDGFTLAAGENQVKTLGSIAPNAIGFVDYRVVVDPTVVGERSIRVNISAAPGDTKDITTKVLVSAQPRLDVPAGASLISLPYSFDDSSFDSIFGLQTGLDFQAFRFDPLSNKFFPAESAQRGVGYWVIPTSDLGNYILQNAKQPTDQGQGGLLVTLQNGWNLIGNPYSIPIKLKEINGVFADNPANVFTYDEVVQQGLLGSSLISFERPGGVAGQYEYLTGGNSVMLPHKGYWVYCYTFQPLRLVFPPVFAEGLPGSGRSEDSNFIQSDRNWRLQLAVRTQNEIDSQNYVGQVRDQRTARTMTMPKPPMAPNAKTEISIKGSVNGQDLSLSRAFTNTVGRSEWTVNVKALEAGEYTVTWPNLGSVPRGVRLKMVDKATGETRDLRATSGYTFRMNAAGTREFNLVAEPGGSSRAVITNVVVTRPTRDTNAPVNIAYSLSASANVTVRVLSATGREVFTVTRGRSEGAGENTATWYLRDSANRAVAPGTYRVEILAETTNGERVRRIVPVNVVR